jgi:tetratricopeptide (TPR) repeat protein
MLERGEITAFDASFASFSNLASELRQQQSLWYTPLYRSMRALLDGSMARALSLQSDLAAVAARVEDANAFHSLVAQSSILNWEIGSLDGAIDGLIEGTRRYPAIRGFRAAVAWAYSKTSRLSEARREFECLASAGFSDVPERFDWTAAVTLSAEVACDIGDKARAWRLYDLLDPLRRRFLFIGLGVASFGSADRLLGRLSETMGRFEQAEAHFQVAVERNAAAGAHAWTAHSKLDYALLLARTGGAARRDYRVRMASEALETATDLGLVGLKERAEAFLQGARAD